MSPMSLPDRMQRNNGSVGFDDDVVDLCLDEDPPQFWTSSNALTHPKRQFVTLFWIFHRIEFRILHFHRRNQFFTVGPRVVRNCQLIILECRSLTKRGHKVIIMQTNYSWIANCSSYVLRGLSARAVYKTIYFRASNILFTCHGFCSKFIIFLEIGL